MRYILILSLLLPFDVFSQKSYKSPNAYQKVLSHKAFAILPFDFKITGRIPNTINQFEYQENVEIAEAEGGYSCQNLFASKILKKLGRGKIITQVQPVVRTNAILERAEITSENISELLPEEICDILGVDGVIYGSVESNKILSTGASIGLQFLGFDGIPTASSNANLSLYDKEGELLWNWSSRRLQTNDFTGTEGLIRYLIRRATKKFPYFQRR